MENSKIHLTYDSVNVSYLMQIKDIPKNVFVLNDIDNEKDEMFLQGNWVFILFAGYSGYDIMLVCRLLGSLSQFSKLNFGFKPYMDLRKMQKFTEVNLYKKVTPIMLQRQHDVTTFLGSQLVKVEDVVKILKGIR
ncbi:hypothetical protein [Tenacibaculum ovolyticum]|uniref:hypothetical protein n=1 Tax=Tenacibaculum ovolyticum TaxID=104270 RepID=UPI00048C0032|nr:hypothetical protein [Tenacibaculum ovolyticum]